MAGRRDLGIAEQNRYWTRLSRAVTIKACGFAADKFQVVPRFVESQSSGQEFTCLHRYTGESSDMDVPNWWGIAKVGFHHTVHCASC